MQKTQIKNEQHAKNVEFQDDFNIHHILDEVFQSLAVMPNCKKNIMELEAGAIIPDIITTSLQKSDFIALSETLHTAINEKKSYSYTFLTGVQKTPYTTYARNICSS